MKKIRSSRKSKTTTVGTLAAFTAAGSAQGAIQTFTTTITAAPASGGVGGVFNWNIDGTGAVEVPIIIKSATISNSFGSFGGPVYEGDTTGTFNLANGFQLAVPNATNNIHPVNQGDTISGAVSFYANFGYIPDVIAAGLVDLDFTSGQSAYIGFQFDPSGSQVLYGYASITLTSATAPGSASADYSIQINSWAYEDSGAPIVVAPIAVPEPSTTAAGLGALALGAAGLARWRQRKRASVEA